MSLDDLADYLRVKGRNRFPDPEHVAKSIQRAVRSSYRLDKVVEDSIDTIIGTSITLIRAFEKQIKELDKSIKRIMKGVPQTLQRSEEHTSELQSRGHLVCRLLLE